MAFQKVVLLLACSALAAGDKVGFRQSRRFNGGGFNQVGRQGRQDGGAVTGGVDFSGCQTDPDTGFCCIEKEESVTTLQKDPILECTHKNIEKCHYTYVTQFEPAQEEVCEENFEKTCQVTFKQQATEEQVKKCYKPLEKRCDGSGPEECRTVYESSCTTRYIEKQPGKFVGDTSCEKLPVEICGAGCTTVEGTEECHDKTITSLLDVPEEVCDLNPQKTCRFQTRLVPKLAPKHECTIIPQETCNLKFSNPEQVEKPLKTKWCLDPAAPTPDGGGYEETPDRPPPVTRPPINDSGNLPQSQTPAPLPTYGNQPPPPPTPPPTLYSASAIRDGRQDDFFNADSVSAFVPAPVVTTQQRRRGRNGGRRRSRNGRRLRQRNQQQFQKVSRSFN